MDASTIFNVEIGVVPVAIFVGLFFCLRRYWRRQIVWREAGRRSTFDAASPLHAVVVDLVVMPRLKELVGAKVRIRLPGAAPDARWFAQRTPGPWEIASPSTSRLVRCLGREGDDLLFGFPLCSRSVVRIEAISSAPIATIDVQAMQDGLVVGREPERTGAGLGLNTPAGIMALTFSTCMLFGTLPGVARGGPGPWAVLMLIAVACNVALIAYVAARHRIWFGPLLSASGFPSASTAHES